MPVTHAVAGHHIEPARFAGAVLGSINAGLVSLVAWRIKPRRAFAATSGVLAAIAPSLVAISDAVLSETLFITLALLLTVLVLGNVRSARTCLALGFICGVAMLVRTVGATLIVAAVVAAVCVPSSASRRLLRAVAVIAGLALATAPWVIRDALVLHTFVPITTQGGYTMVTTYNKANLQADTPEIQQEPSDLPEFAALTGRPGIPETTVASREMAEALSVLPHPLFVLRATINHLDNEWYLGSDVGRMLVSDQ